MTPQVRAEIIIAARDEASKPLAHVGATGKTAMNDLRQGATGAIQSLTGLNMASLGLAGLMVGAAGALKFAVQQAAEAERVMALTESVIKSTGGAAGFTAEQIANMSMKLSNLNNISDETIQEGANLLLTFKKVRGEGFQPALQAAVDLSTIMKTDLRSSVMMVGKALEDPTRGITALRRAGVSFTADQQAVIKALVETGRAAEAQAMILAELNSQVGGAGAAAADTLIGKMEGLKVKSGNVAEAWGSFLIPVLSDGIDLFIKEQQVMSNFNLAWQDRLGLISTEERLQREAAVAAGDLSAVWVEQADAVATATDRTQDYALRLAGDVRQTQQDYNTDLSNTKLGYENMGAAANAAVPALDPLIAAQDKLALGMKAYNDQLLFNLAAQNLDAEAAFNLAYHMGLIDERSLDAAAGVDELTRKYDTNHDGIVDNIEATKGYYGELLTLQSTLNSLQDKTVNIYMNTTYTSTYLEEYRAATGGGRAAGGPVSAGTSYIVGEQGREIFTPSVDGTITPNSKIGQGGAGVTIENLNISVPSGDARAISAAIAGELRRALKSGVAGVGA